LYHKYEDSRKEWRQNILTRGNNSYQYLGMGFAQLDYHLRFFINTNFQYKFFMITIPTIIKFYNMYNNDKSKGEKFKDCDNKDEKK
ncbi:MAG: hypothetical protein KGY74_09360, partial [Candidatus Cloacimonetes bacterium]|nr:hypothetical protein [Candidatus Cloacimonadota bacterium]